ncbi:hypothetical protein [Tuwongella immobilis]|uniref:Repeat-companion domain protein n=1 Tax=Tuwongella immobilis TaxID=692036 RepID=A0A6C2YUA7_9BACT|nr:hypothetical protein [Tuwongella immobilis]VIP04971.1 unnamed protein product [Tuwongella immobilis]VTS07300.1 unnamed protein product [Tuwongella immobilis]
MIPDALIDALHLDDDAAGMAGVLSDWCEEHELSDLANYLRLTIAMRVEPESPDWFQWRDAASWLRWKCTQEWDFHRMNWRWCDPEFGQFGLDFGEIAVSRWMWSPSPRISQVAQRSLVVDANGVRGLPLVLSQEWALRWHRCRVDVSADAAVRVWQQLVELREHWRFRHLDLPWLDWSLVELPGAERLQSLRLSQMNGDLAEDAATIRALVQGEGLPQLQSLALDCGRDPDLLERVGLSASGPWRPLRALQIQNHGADRETMTHLGNWLAAGGIERFAFVDCGRRTNHAPIDALLDQTSRACQLRELDFTGTYLPAQVMHRLATWPGMATIRTLRIVPSGVNDAALLSLGYSTLVNQLRILELRGGDFSPLGLVTLAESPLAESLCELALGTRQDAEPADWCWALSVMGHRMTNVLRLTLDVFGSAMRLPMILESDAFQWPELRELQVACPPTPIIMRSLNDSSRFPRLWRIRWPRTVRTTEYWDVELPTGWAWASAQDLVRKDQP